MYPPGHRIFAWHPVANSSIRSFLSTLSNASGMQGPKLSFRGLEAADIDKGMLFHACLSEFSNVDGIQDSLSWIQWMSRNLFSCLARCFSDTWPHSCNSTIGSLPCVMRKHSSDSFFLQNLVTFAARIWSSESQPLIDMVEFLPIEHHLQVSLKCWHIWRRWGAQAENSKKAGSSLQGHTWRQQDTRHRHSVNRWALQNLLWNSLEMAYERQANPLQSVNFKSFSNLMEQPWWWRFSPRGCVCSKATSKSLLPLDTTVVVKWCLISRVYLWVSWPT